MPPTEAPRLDALIDALHAELQRPPDEHSPEVQRHLLSTILLWIERWYDASRTERREADDAEVQLHRRFTRRLEEDFARHHDAAHYADALGVPAAALSRALAHVTGRATKDLITERVMLEAARLLRFTDLAVERGRPPRRLRRPALLLARVQAPPRRVAAGLPRPRAREVHGCVTSCHSIRAPRRRC